METGHIIAFNIALLAAMVSPGPALLLLLRMTLTSGTKAGIATGLGLGLMASLYTLCALFGLNIVFSLFPWAYVAVKTIGALYLIYIAWGMWRDAKEPLTGAPAPARHAFRTGFLVNLGNPKSVLFASAVLLVIFPPALSMSDKLVIWTNHLLVEIVLYSLFTMVLSTRRARDGYMSAKPWLDRLAAGVMGLLGLRLLVSK